MKDKELVAELSRRLGMTHKEVAEILSEVGPFIASLMNEETTVEINNFGTFEVEKEVMYVENDTTNGKKYLVPPKLSPVFVPDAVLVKTTKGVSS